MLFLVKIYSFGILLLLLQSCHSTENTLPEIKIWSDTTGNVITLEKGTFYPNESIQQERKYRIDQEVEYFYKSDQVYERNDSVVGFDFVIRGWEKDSIMIDSILYHWYKGFYSEARNLKFKNGASFYTSFSISLQSLDELTYKESKEIMAYIMTSLEQINEEGKVTEGAEDNRFSNWFYKIECDTSKMEINWLGFESEWKTKHYWNYAFHEKNTLIVKKADAPIFIKLSASLSFNNKKETTHKHSYLKEMEW